jgi:hypothetical protein
VKNTGLFFGVDDNKENPDTVLEYRKDSRLASPPNSPGAKLGRSSTFDEMLRSPSSEGQLTPPSTIVSKEEDPSVAAEKASEPETELHPPQPESAGEAAKVQNRIPFLVPAENEAGDISGRTTPEGTTNLEEKAPETEETKMGAGGESAMGHVSNDKDAKEQEPLKVEESQTPEVAAEVNPSKSKGKGKGKATEVATDEQPDEIDQLLKEWTTVYE